MFKKMKQKLLDQNNIGRYLSYAAGEVILIVIGILVAVSIDNWNEERQQNKVVNGIYAVILNDIKQDTAEVNHILDFYSKKEATFLKIAYDTLKANKIGECDLCPYLLSNFSLFNVNKRGIYQLNEYMNYTLSNQDSLVLNIVNFYTTLIDDVENINSMIKEDIMGNHVYWRDNYQWFARSMQGKLKKEDLSYFKSQGYRNKVAFHYELIHDNYLPLLQVFQKDSESIIKELNERLNDNL